MSQTTEEEDLSQYYQKSLPDYLDQLSFLMYAAGALLFLGGLWIDWQNPGQVFFDALVFTDEPYANSGLFIASILIFAGGWVVSKTGDKIEEYRSEEIEDQTQEWVVDVGNR